jgi:hypothetical protein
MLQNKYEVATVLQQLGNGIESIGLNTHQLRHLNAIKKCRTAALGGHIDECSNCKKIHISYNSCRNRHCPKCQGHKRQQWMNARTAELLPLPYFHVVFTLPHQLNGLAMQHPAIIYNALFAAAWHTINYFTSANGLHGGAIAILHTWGQNLSLHPHVHCIVPGGGVNKNMQWRTTRGQGKYLYSVKAMSKVYRAKYLQLLRAHKICTHEFTQTLFRINWVVYAKRPFGNTSNVIEYLGRYTHKVAISNSRLRSVDDANVHFGYKDYKAGGTKKTMQLTLQEFTRRFAQHILPHGFVRIRHYGILSSTWKRQRLPSLQQAMQHKPIEVSSIAPSLHKKCPCCKVGMLTTIAIFDKRGPPPHHLMAQKNNPA